MLGQAAAQVQAAVHQCRKHQVHSFVWPGSSLSPSVLAFTVLQPNTEHGREMGGWGEAKEGEKGVGEWGRARSG